MVSSQWRACLPSPLSLPVGMHCVHVHVRLCPLQPRAHGVLGFVQLCTWQHCTGGGVLQPRALPGFQGPSLATFPSLSLSPSPLSPSLLLCMHSALFPSFSFFLQPVDACACLSFSSQICFEEDLEAFDGQWELQMRPLEQVVTLMAQRADLLALCALLMVMRMMQMTLDPFSKASPPCGPGRRSFKSPWKRSLAAAKGAA